MAKYRGPVCRLCRREGEKLFLKGTRCMTIAYSFVRSKNSVGFMAFRSVNFEGYSNVPNGRLESREMRYCVSLNVVWTMSPIAWDLGLRANRLASSSVTVISS